MFSRFIVVFILVLSVLSSPVYADKLSLKSRLRRIFYPNTVKTKPVKVKTIPSGSACTPDVPKNCDVKK